MTVQSLNTDASSKPSSEDGSREIKYTQVFALAAVPWKITRTGGSSSLKGVEGRLTQVERL